MPVQPTYPGVYVEEVQSGVRTIMGVATSITAFIGRARRGLLDKAVRIQSYADFDRKFGGLWEKSPMSYAVQQYFLNGGAEAIIVRVAKGGAAATVGLPAGTDALHLTAASIGTWGDNLQAIVDYETKDKDDPSPSLFNLTIQETRDGNVVSEEVFRNLSVQSSEPLYVEEVLKQRSELVRVTGAVPTTRPAASAEVNGQYQPTPFGPHADADGLPIGSTEVVDSALETAHKGLWALDKVDLFNLLCIPPFDRDSDVDKTTLDAAAKYCGDRRAMLIVDPPMSESGAWEDPDHVISGLDGRITRTENAALFYPSIKLPDPRKDNRIEAFAPCGAVAGIFARTDAERGVWKAPAGQDATLSGVYELGYKLTDGENGRLNPLAVNCLRTFPIVGHVVWGSRTLKGADRLASEWKYIPVRRLALFIEESLYRGTQWVVFEPNDEPLWAQIRLNVGAFMHNLFRQGAFQGTSPRDAYFVKCDKETTTQNDINQGIVNILVGFAPLKPAEFVIIKISQIAGQIET